MTPADIDTDTDRGSALVTLPGTAERGRTARPTRGQRDPGSIRPTREGQPRHHLGVTFAALAALAVLSGACSLGDRQELADRVVDATNATAALEVVSGTVNADFSLAVKARDAATGFQNLPQGDSASARFQIVGSEGALLGADSPTSGFPLVIFDDQRIYLRRPTHSEDARPWIELGLDDLSEGNGQLEETSVDAGVSAAVMAVLDPRVVLDLTAGILAGSIEERGAEVIDGIETARFAGNFDIARALEDTREGAYDEDRLERTQRVLSLLSITDDVHPGQVWVADDGTVKRLEIELELDVDRQVAFSVTLRMDIAGSTTRDSEFAVPERSETVLVDTLVPFERAAAVTAASDPTDLLGG